MIAVRWYSLDEYGYSLCRGVGEMVSCQHAGRLPSFNAAVPLAQFLLCCLILGALVGSDVLKQGIRIVLGSTAAGCRAQGDSGRREMRGPELRVAMGFGSGDHILTGSLR